MKCTLRIAGLVTSLLIALTFIACNNASKPAAENKAGLEEALSTATDAYIYGYPLVTMDMTRKRLTNVAVPGEANAPMGQMVKLRTYPAVDNHAVTAPNADTLYTMTWLDVSKEPWILSVPDMGNRYYLLPFLDGWTDVFEVPGTRTTGGKAAKYAITGPGWSGTLPDGVKELKSPTGIVWLLGRIYCTGTPEDYKAVHALQDKFELVPLSSYGKPYTPLPNDVDNALDMKTAVRDLVDHMEIYDYFTYLARLMKTNPPAADDAPIVARMAKIGIVPGQDFDSSKLDAFDKEAIKGVPKAALLKMLKYVDDDIPKVNGWLYTTKTGLYGTDYMQRAVVTAIGLGANRPQDAIYPTGLKDADGKELDAGSNKYVMHFDKGQMPPAKGFWSITMYDKDYFFVPNALNRYTLSSRNKFVTNADGSVDLYLQADSPGKAKEANWLPAPKAKFVPMMRLYWPSETPPSIIDGSWKPPAVTSAK
ncbi:MAG TPA: DUF1254 domain-containing protein [Terriglobales bacterium]|nr:DUF1254 domain-containing protein [Terriglobales bacterium]